MRRPPRSSESRYREPVREPCYHPESWALPAMGRVGSRVDGRNNETAKSRDRVVCAGRRCRLLLSLQQLVDRVNDRRAEVALVAAEHAELLVASDQDLHHEERGKADRERRKEQERQFDAR